MTNFKTTFGFVVAAICIILGLQTMVMLVQPFSYLFGDTYSMFGYNIYTYVSEGDRDAAAFVAMAFSFAIWFTVFVYAARVRDIIVINARMLKNTFSAPKLLK
jgi:hypothetical protein